MNRISAIDGAALRAPFPPGLAAEGEGSRRSYTPPGGLSPDAALSVRRVGKISSRGGPIAQ